MRRKFLERLASPLRAERLRAWNELHLEPTASHGVLSPADRQQLAKILAAEDDDGVHRTGVNVLLGFSCCACDQPGRATHKAEPAAACERSLDDWLSSDLRKATAVFRASERAYSRRDSDAVESLARRLPFTDFPLVHFHPLPLREDGWRQIATEHPYETICVVGRLGLLGQQAVADLQNPQARFRFIQQFPPPTYKPGAVLKEYHVIQEYDQDRLLREYFTEDTADSRTDYGIVQRYPLYVHTHNVTVLLCAGSSSLGTVGAARWLAHDLGRPQDPATRAPILVPKAIGPKSRVEALIRTIGAAKDGIWRPSKIELVSLFVDHFQWSPEDLQWHDIQQHVVEVRCRDGKAVSLLIDGQRAKLNSDSQNFRLAVAVALGIVQSGGGVDVEQLAHDQEIWGNRVLPTSKVKQRLHNLDKQALKGTLIIDRQVRLDAQVKVAEE